MIALAASVAATLGVAQASYELLVVADFGDGSSLGALHRFDPVSRSYFGSFGSGIVVGPRSVAIRPGTRTAYVGDFNGLHRFNVDSGAYLGRLNDMAISSSMTFGVDGNLYSTFGNSLSRINPDTGSFTVLNAPSPSGFMFGLDASVANVAPALYFQSSSANFMTGTFTQSTGAFAYTSTTSTPATGYSNLHARYVPHRNSGQRRMYVAGSSMSADYVFVSYDAFGAPTGVTATSSANLDEAAGVARAHSGIYLSGRVQGSLTQGTILFVDNFGREAYTFGSNVLKNPQGMDTILAPEPGTVAALGLGALALLRRRRAR